MHSTDNMTRRHLVWYTCILCRGQADCINKYQAHAFSWTYLSLFLLQVTSLNNSQVVNILSYQAVAGFEELSTIHEPTTLNITRNMAQLSVDYAGGNTAKVRSLHVYLYYCAIS